MVVAEQVGELSLVGRIGREVVPVHGIEEPQAALDRP